MSNKPIYLRRKKGVSLLYLILFICIIFAGWYFAKNDTSWQEILLDSSLKNKDFQAKVEEKKAAYEAEQKAKESNLITIEELDKVELKVAKILTGHPHHSKGCLRRMLSCIKA